VTHKAKAIAEWKDSPQYRPGDVFPFFAGYSAALKAAVEACEGTHDRDGTTCPNCVNNCIAAIRKLDEPEQLSLSQKRRLHAQRPDQFPATDEVRP
jgi:hypothetical protein